MTALTHDEYERGRYFMPLDGLRAVSVLMVLLHHMPEKRFFIWLNGYAGVTVFFVLSGYLITTLCIREMAQRDDRRMSLSGFYIKRAFRILPLYFVALAAYGVLTRGWGLTGTWQEYVDNLPYYLTLNGDLIKDRLPFAISWSLGIEEKFYVVWPLLLVLTRRLSTGALVGLGVALVVVDFGLSPASEYLELYLAILVGCTLAFAMNHPGCYSVIRRVVGLPGFGFFVTVVACATLVSLPHYNGVSPAWPGASLLAVGFIPTVAALLAYVVMNPTCPSARLLSTPPARWIGNRSYAIYLFHAMTIHVVGTIVTPEYDGLTLATRVLMAMLITIAVADLMHRVVEVPFRKMGRRIVHARGSVGLPSVAESKHS